jgi:hypothetical protein
VRSAIVILTLGGCNQAFDLKPTISIDASRADIDGDGVTDAEDNCPTLANSDQMNGDGDAFGDACDTCPALASSSTHDEDRDRVGDDCDICPGTSDFGLDEDHDGVGDLCDLKPDKVGQPDHRALFEPFVTMPADWVPDMVPWSEASDSIAPDRLLGPGDRLRNIRIMTPGVWSATVGFEALTHWDQSDSYSVRAENAVDSIECSVVCTSNTDVQTTSCLATTAHNGFPQLTTVVIPQPRVLIKIFVKDVGAPFCIFGTSNYEQFASAFPVDGMKISITASPRIRVAYFDYITQ